MLSEKKKMSGDNGSLFVPNKKKDEFLEKLFTDPKTSIVAFSSPRKVYEYIKSLGITNFTLSEVKAFEKKRVRENQLLRSRKDKVIKRLPTIAYGLDDTFQLDLVDMHDGKFVLSKIDVLSKKGDCIAIPNKSASAVLEGIQKLIFRNGGVFPNKIQTDEGKEFFNARVQKYFRDNEVNHFHSFFEKKAAVVERFNATWQKMYYKYKQRYPKVKRQELLDWVVKNYNNQPHSAIENIAPSQVDVDVASVLVRRQLDARQKAREAIAARPVAGRKQTRRKRIVFAFKDGDRVRITRERGVFFKSYKGTFTEEVFVVNKAFVKPSAPDVVLYKLRDLLGEEIKGIFYENQLQKVFKPEKEVMEKIERRDPRLGYLVKLRDHPKDFTKWLTRREIREKYDVGPKIRTRF